MYNKLCSLKNYSFDKNGQMLLADSYTKYRFGGFRDVNHYAQPDELVPWLREIIKQARETYPQALTLFPDNQFWNEVLNIETITRYSSYSEPKIDTLSYEKKGIFRYGPSAVETCAAIYNRGLLQSDDILLDIGSGEGAFLAYSAVLPLREVIGVEIRSALYEKSLLNFKNHCLLYPQIKTTLRCDNILNCQDLIERATVFYLCNPVGQKLLKEILKTIEQSLKANPREIKFIYASSKFNLTVSRQQWLSSAVAIKADNENPLYFWENIK